MNSSSSDHVVCSILDMPDEILVKIILCINATKRFALAHSCKRFHNLVFGDEELLRELDFSEDGHLTTPAHIEGYFGDDRIRDNVRKVNIRNVMCMGPGVKMLNDTIGRATNLVDVNIHGIKFENISEIASFLEPLVHIKRLSLDWCCSNEDDFAIYKEALQKRFSKLTYFSANADTYAARVFFSTLELCKELEELRIDAVKVRTETMSDSWVYPVTKLRNLRIVQISGWRGIPLLRERVISMLSDIDKWTEFQPISYEFRESCGFYLEKNVEICEQLRNSDWFRNSQSHGDSEPGLTLDYMSLLEEIIQQTRKDLPATCCCSRTPITSGENYMEYPCVIEINDAKKLLKNPRHQISFLDIRHDIEPDCDVHSFVLAFENLTELVLTGIKKQGALTSKAEAPNRPDSNSAFQMLIQNTPLVEKLAIHSEYARDKWDLQSLRFISSWKNLRALRLSGIPLKDGRFLIDIGRQCPNLEILHLTHLGLASSYTRDLPEMLNHCRNLQVFVIVGHKINNMANVVNSLSNNLNLRSFRVTFRSFNSSTLELIPSIEGLLRQCVNLSTFVFKILLSHTNDSDQLTSAVRRITSEFDRPEFQFELRIGKFRYSSFPEEICRGKALFSSRAPTLISQNCKWYL